jgi:hypothetical protein
MKPESILGLIAILFILIPPPRCSADDAPFQIEYRDGTTVSVDFVKKQLSWTSVSGFGQTSKRQIDISQIRSLKLTTEPAGDQLANILKLIGQLDSEEFYVREEAEKTLRSTGKRFRSVIQNNNSLKTQDGIYRLKRVLSSLRVSPSQKNRIELDELVLLDGTKLSGDAGGDDFEVKFRGKTISVARKLLSRILKASPVLNTRTERREAINTKLFHSHVDFMKDREVKLVDFERKPDGVALSSLDKNISDNFVDIGLLLGTEYPKGCVGISGGRTGPYEIKAGDKPVGGNSACVYKSLTGGRTGNRFQGVMEITFCEPGNKNIPRGVKDFGIFLSRVNHSRDLLVEAWDSMDRLIGVCESNDEPCTFCGISSSTPIAKIRILSNPWILELRRQNAEDEDRGKQLVDKDYAVDNMMFSTPLPIDSIKKERHFLGRNGDMIPLNWARIYSQDRIEFGSRNFQLLSSDLASANTIGLKTTPKQLPQKLSSNTQWMAMLSDNSILKWNPKTPLRSTTVKIDLERKDIVAIWPAGRQPRLPLKGDFEDGNNVIVYPGCRVVTPKVEFDTKGFRWNNPTVKTEPLHDDNEFKVDARLNDKPDDVAPRKTDYSFDLSSIPEYEIPTIWFKPPTSILSTEGAIRLNGGEVLIYGEGANFQLQSMDRSRIQLTYGGEELSIPLSQVVSILPPSN